jgi:D-alanyl-D-alanine carboxypeptidase
MIAKLLPILLLVVSFSASAQQPTPIGVAAKSYIVTDLSGNVILGKDVATPRPIASITKILVAEQIRDIQEHQDLVEIQSSDLATRHTRLHPSDHLTHSDLLSLALIASNNQAIYALARAHGMDTVIAAVNSTASSRNLNSITIEEPSGLSANNKGSAQDLAKFIAHISTNPLTRISVEPTLAISHGNFYSTNPLLGKPGWNFTVSKTGFINAAGGCLVSLVEIGGLQRIVVILGSTDTKTRWSDLIKIRKFIAQNDTFWVPPSTAKKYRRRQHR